MEEETLDPDDMCRKCDTKTLLNDFDPDIAARVVWLMRQKHHLQCGANMHELGLTVADLDEIMYIDQMLAQANEIRAKQETEKARYKMTVHARQKHS